MEQLEFAKHLRSCMTESETLLWRHLRAHRLNGGKFRRQQPIGPYVVLTRTEKYPGFELSAR